MLDSTWKWVKPECAIFDVDKAGVDWADVVVAITDDPDPDSGTCWRCGPQGAGGGSLLLGRVMLCQ